MAYDLDTMTPDEINQVIHTKVLGRPEYEPCYGPVTATLCIRGGAYPSTVLWYCDHCRHTLGEYALDTALPKVEHKVLPPDYLASLTLALQVLFAIHRTWSREQKFLYDFYLCGIQHPADLVAETMEISNTAMVDRLAAALNPKLICYAAIHTLNEWEQRAQASVAKSEAREKEREQAGFYDSVAPAEKEQTG